MIGLVPGAASTSLATLVGLIRSLFGLLAVAHHGIAAGVSLRAGAAYPAWPSRGGHVVSIALDEGLVIGVGTHLDTHTAAVWVSR